MAKPKNSRCYYAHGRIEGFLLVLFCLELRDVFSTDNYAKIYRKLRDWEVDCAIQNKMQQLSDEETVRDP